MTRLLPVLQSFSSRAATVATPATVLARSGIVRPYSPRTIARLGLELRRWGTGPAGGFVSPAVRVPRILLLKRSTTCFQFKFRCVSCVR